MRLQCKHCPWRVSTDPRQIPSGYSADKHALLSRTIAAPGAFTIGPVRMMACHETPVGRERPCVGWLHHQLGAGNNVGLRYAVMRGRVDANVEIVGDQRPSFQDTLPRGIL